MRNIFTLIVFFVTAGSAMARTYQGEGILKEEVMAVGDCVQGAYFGGFTAYGSVKVCRTKRVWIATTHAFAADEVVAGSIQELGPVVESVVISTTGWRSQQDAFANCRAQLAHYSNRVQQQSACSALETKGVGQ